MRVLHLTPFYAPAWEWGGPVEGLRQLARGQTEIGLRVEVATTTQRGGHRAPLEARVQHREGATVHYHRALSSSRFFLAPTLAAQLLGGGYDILHVHGVWTFSSLVGAIAGARTPWVLTPHGCLEGWALRQHHIKKQAYLQLAGRLLQRAGALHYASDSEAAHSRFAGRRAAVIPLPVDVDRFAEVPALPGAVARRKSGAPFTLLYLGRLHPVKGLELLLPALAEVAVREPVRLVVAGPDESGYRPQLRRAARGLGLEERLVIRGLLGRSKVAEALAECHAVVLPSHQESFGMAAAEAMAAGRPVLVSDQVGIAPAVTESRAGWVVPLRHQAWVDALREAARKVGPGAGERGRAYAQAHWRPAAVAETTRALYRQVLRDRYGARA